MLHGEIAERHAGRERIAGLIADAIFEMRGGVADGVEFRNAGAMRIHRLRVLVDANAAARHEHARIEPQAVEWRLLERAEASIGRIAAFDCVALRQAPFLLAPVEIPVDALARKAVEARNGLVQALRRNAELVRKFARVSPRNTHCGGGVPGFAPQNEKPSTYWLSKIR